MMLPTELIDAMVHIPLNLDTTRKVGIVLKARYGDKYGLPAWLDWINPEGEAAARDQWKSLEAHSDADVAAIYTLARHHGWIGTPAVHAFSDEEDARIRLDQQQATQAALKKQAAEVERRPVNGSPAHRNGLASTGHAGTRENSSIIYAGEGYGTSRRLDTAPEANHWPVLHEAALPGIVGNIVAKACENSEADPAAVLASVLAWFGTSFGTGPHVMVGDTKHCSRIFCFKVGASAIARKGTSEGPAKRIFRKAEELSANRTPLVVSPGPLSTGEGIVRAVRDESEDRDNEGNPDDPGVTDKRLLVIEGELGAPLKAAQREGNTLSAILRMAWDSGDIAPLTKSNRIKATDAHISILGHITRHELTQLLRTCDIWNGFANRVLWFCVRRPKHVAFPEPMNDATVEALAQQVRIILDHAAMRGRLTWTEDAKAHWTELYPQISVEEYGAFGAVTARAEAQIQRLSLIYALIDCSEHIEHRHFKAAVAVWEFAKASARLIFEGTSEDPNQSRVLDSLRIRPHTQSQLNDAFSGHLKGSQLKRLLEDMQAAGLIRATTEKTSGRPITRWSLTTPEAEKAEKAEELTSANPYPANSAYSAGDVR